MGREVRVVKGVVRRTTMGAQATDDMRQIVSKDPRPTEFETTVESTDLRAPLLEHSPSRNVPMI